MLDGLHPVMSLVARPVRVAELPAGWGISYGPTFRTARPSRIATLPLGYGDGWSRQLSNRASALVRGRRVPLVGNVAMDAVMADVTDVPGPPVDGGDEFVLLGASGDERVTAAELAQERTTNSWEVVTAMARRLPRVYHAAAGPVGLRTLSRAEGPLARIELWNGDICDLEVDAIVNAANLSLWMSTGVGGAIKRAGGDAIEFAAVRQAPVPLGGAIVTPAGKLAARRSSTRSRSIATGARARRSSKRPSAAPWPAPARSARRASPSRRSARASVASRSTRRPGSPSRPSATSSAQPDHRPRRLRPARRAAYQAFSAVLHPTQQAIGGSDGVSIPYEATEEQRDELVEQVAREIQLRGLTGPAVHFLEASRPYRPLGANAMLFFDPVLRGVFGGELASASEILADDTGIELLIARLEEPDEEVAWDA